ncbi:MAG: hypothetical protein ACRENB_07840 [Gemmatimonadales bacterium]
MNEQLRQRILRRLETLSDQRGYQILDFVEFLESKYAERAAPTNILAKITEGIEDTMRAAKIPIKGISTTMDLMGGAGKVMKGVAAAAQSVVDEALQAAAPLKEGSGPAAPQGDKLAAPPPQEPKPDA